MFFNSMLYFKELEHKKFPCSLTYSELISKKGTHYWKVGSWENGKTNLEVCES